jgi:hypothetical protein
MSYIESIIAGMTIGVLFLLTIAQSWDKPKAFDYLEQGQRDWANWKSAQRNGGPCLSCHTGLAFTFARRANGEAQPRASENDLVHGIRTRLAQAPPEAAMTDAGAEAVLNLLMLALIRNDAKAPLDATEQTALKMFWNQQLSDGPRQGSWTWFLAGLEPWDEEHSAFFGTALAARAMAAFPKDDRTQTIHDYLRRAAARKPLHDRLAWAAFSARKEERRKVLDELWAAQASDGGWATASLGPWLAKPSAPADLGSSNYATAWGAFMAYEAGTKCTDPRLRKALDWLASRQDRASGAWPSPSMNKVYPPGSIQSRFMTHAATGYATAALAACRR